MTQLAMILGAGLALVGHGALWVGIVNRWHATGFPRKVVKAVTLAFYAALLGLPLVIAAEWAGQFASDGFSWRPEWNWATGYLAITAAIGAVHLPVWARRMYLASRVPECVRVESLNVVDIAGALGREPASGLRAKMFCKVPYNQLWQLHVTEARVRLANLPTELRGVSICHWSDLHFSGRIDRDYFHEVVRITAALEPDIIALTGDVCDAAHCIDWVVETLSVANARLGKYFILGNHDLRTKDVARLRSALSEAGFVDVGGRQLVLYDGKLVLAGNELPWLGIAPQAGDRHASGGALRVLLSHSPDQYAWARRQGYDLMLAGHTHGGQIRFPLIGPIVCPSWHGTRYACGYFDEPPTVTHVSRGTASLFPLRINCPPEITKLVLEH